MPRYTLDGESFPLVIAAPGPDRRWFLLGFLIQGTGDGLVRISGGDGGGVADVLMASVRTSAGGGGAIAEQSAAEIGTSEMNRELVIETTGSPGTVTGYIDYCWR